MYSCRQRDVIFCLQETGSLSLKLRRKPIANYLMSPMDVSPVSEASKGNFSFTVHNIFEIKFYLFYVLF